MARINAGGEFKSFRQLVREAALVCFCVELPDLYCDMVLSGKLRLSEAAREYKCEYPEAERVRH